MMKNIEFMKTLNAEVMVDLLKYRQYCNECPYKSKKKCPNGSSECNEAILRWLNSERC